jgi:tRNA (guanine37-N1)-methyltransferase
LTKFLKRVLKGLIPDEELTQLFSSFDIVGNIAIIKIPDSLLIKKKIIGETILSTIPHLKSVFLQKTSVAGEYRLRELELIAGEDKYITIYKEHGCQFFVNVATSYFSPRLSTERLRIANLVSAKEIVVNMFAGVGTFSILIAKKTPTAIVYSVDSNVDAFVQSIINSKINKVDNHVESLHGDAKDVLSSSMFKGSADRVLLPLPERSFEFVDTSVNCLKPSGGYIHFFSHIKSNYKHNVIENSENHVNSLFSNYDYKIEHTQIVRDVGPRIYQTVTDIFVKKG